MSGIVKLINAGITPGVVFVTSDGSSGFSSISAAAASLVGIADSAHPYDILVRSGVYTEPVINVPPFVSIRGDSVNTVVVKPDGNHDVIVMSNMTEVAFLTIDGDGQHTPGSGHAGLFFNDVGDFAQAHKVSIYDCDIGVDCDNSASATTAANVYLEYVDVNGVYTYGLEVDTYIDMSTRKYYGVTTGMGTIQWTVTETDVDLADSTIHINGHGRYTGGKLLYTATDGIPIGGLTSGTSYYIIVVDPNYIKLALTFSDAQAGTFIVLTRPAASDHQFDLVGAQFVEDLDRMGSADWTFLGSAVAANEISVAHSRITGDRTLYTADTTEITGLVSGTCYYIINTGVNKVKLASTHALALAGTALPISDPGGVTHHRLGVKQWVTDELAGKYVMLRGGNSFGQDRLIDHNTTQRVSFSLPITQFPLDDESCGYYIGYPMFCNAENAYFFPDAANTGSDVSVHGGGGILSWSVGEIKGATDSDGIEVYEGAEVRLQSVKISGSQDGIHVLNTGSSGAQNAPVLDVLNAWIDYCSDKAILVDNPKTVGQISGDIEPHDIEFDSGVTGVSVFVQSETPQGINIVGNLNLGATLSVVTNYTPYNSQGINVGVVSGGEITRATATTIDVAAGTGYVMTGLTLTDVPKYVEWDAVIGLSLVSLGSPNYIWVNSAGVVAASATAPADTIGIRLSRVITDTNGLVFLQNAPRTITHMGTMLDDASRNAFGPIVQSGLITTTQATPDTSHKLNVTSGIYYYGDLKKTPAGGTGIQFSTWRHAINTCLDAAVEGAFNDEINITAYGWAPNTPVIYTCPGAGKIAALTPGNTYYILAGTNANNFKLSLTASGAPIGLVAPAGGDTHIFTGSGYITVSGVDLVNCTQYDEAVTGMTTLAGTKFAKHLLCTINGSADGVAGLDQHYMLIFGNTVFADEAAAIAGANPGFPSTWGSPTGMVAVAGIVVDKDNARIASIVDERPQLGFVAGSTGAVSKHGDLTGLGVEADHPWALWVDGTNEMLGDLDMGARSIKFHTGGTGVVDGVTVARHASRHLPNAITDALTVGVPSDIGTANAEGGANAFARRDHVHNHPVFTTGLLHTDYLPLSGANPMTGTLSLAGNAIDFGEGFLTFVDSTHWRVMYGQDSIIGAHLADNGTPTNIIFGQSHRITATWVHDFDFLCDGGLYVNGLQVLIVDQAVPQTIGDTTDRLAKLWATDIVCTNTITGSINKSTNLIGGNGTNLLGSIPYQSNTDATLFVAPNTTLTKKFFRMTGDGANGAVPVWDTIIAGDIPTLNQSTTGSAGSLKSASTTGVMTATGMTSGQTRIKTVRDADDTVLELGGTYSPTGTWNWIAGSPTVTWPTFNQSTSGTAANATNTAITEDVVVATAVYPTWVTANAGNLPQKTTSTKLSFVPSTGILTSTGFSGALTGNVTGDCTGNAATVTGLSVTALKTLTVSNSLTLAATDGSTLTIGTGGTLGTAAYTSSGAYLASGGTAADSSKLGGSLPAAYALVGQTMNIGTTAVAINRGSGALSLTGTSIDGSSGSCTGNSATVTGLGVTALKTLTVSNSLTLAATDGATLTIGAGGTLGTAAYTSSGAYLAVGGTAADSSKLGGSLPAAYALVGQTMNIGTTAVAINRGSGALSLAGTSIDGSSGSCTGTASVATNTTITNDVTAVATVYPTWVTANTGNLPQNVSSTKLSFVPSTGTLTSTLLSASTLTSTVATNTAPLVVASTTLVSNLNADKWDSLEAPANASGYLKNDGAGNTSWGTPAKVFTSTDQTITASGTLTLPHGLAGIPQIVTVRLVCQTAELGYVQNDVVSASFCQDAANNSGMAVMMDGTNVNIYFGSAAKTFVVIRKDTGASASITNNRWKLRVLATYIA